MLVAVIYKHGVGSYERKHHAPVSVDGNRPMAFQVTLQGVSACCEVKTECSDGPAISMAQGRKLGKSRRNLPLLAIPASNRASWPVLVGLICRYSARYSLP